MTGFGKAARRLVCILLCIICIASQTLPAAATNTEITEPEATVPHTTVCAVRYRAGSQYNVIGYFENGTTVNIVSEGDEYYKVDCYDMYGYISKEQLAIREDGKYYVNCNPESEETVQMAYTDYAEAIRMRHSLVATAKRHLGTPYVYGGARPGAFDCSGLTMYLYGKQGITLNRRASLQLQNGIIVSREGLMPGDLVFFHETPWDGYEASHVGIYIGDGMIIHSGKRGVSLDSLDAYWFRDYYIGARRVINTDNTQLREGITQTLLQNTSNQYTASGRTLR